MELIFSSHLIQKDTETLQKFKSHCVQSDYAGSLVDKAISANKKLAHHKKPIPTVFAKSADDEADEEDRVQAMDLMQKLLLVNPDDRLTADEAIRHDYVVKFFNPSVENQVRKRTVVPPLDDDTQLSIDEYRGKLYEIIQKQKAR